MAGQIGGTVTWVLDVDSQRFVSGMASAKDTAKRTADEMSNAGQNIKSSFKNSAAGVADSLNSMANSIGGLVIATGAAIGAGSFGLLGMAKASWDQVVAVENASFALKAYEKDASKVTSVLSGLVKYAQSDMGVLFQRQDLFDAASTLKLYGVETDKLVGYVETLSKGVAVGKSSFQELSDIFGRVISSGQMTGDAFDMLVYRGIKLPSTMRNAKVSAEELFTALDQALPDSLLEGRANTIQGVMIRLQSAFRNLGSQILGVDKDTSQFIKGGLGDTIVTTMKNLRDIMASPAMKESFANLGKTIGDFVKDALPLLISGFKWIISNLPLLTNLFIGLTIAFIALKVAALATSIAAMPNPILLIVAAVALLIMGLIWLQAKFNIIGKAMEFLKPIFAVIGQVFKDLWNSIKQLGEVLGKELAPVFEFVSRNIEVFKKILLGVLAVAMAPLILTVGIIIGVIKLLAVVISFIATHFETIKKVVVAVLAVAFAPLIAIVLVVIGIVKLLVAVFNFFVMAIQTVSGWITSLIGVVISAFTMIWNIISTVMNAIWGIIQPILNFILNLYIIVWGTILLVVINVLSGIWNIVTSIFNAISGFIRNTLQGIGNFISAVFNWYWNIITSIFNAIWGFIVNIWNSVYGFISNILRAIGNTVSSIWNWIFNIISSALGGIWGRVVGVWNSVYGYIAGITGSIRNIFAGAAGWLIGAGGDIIRGLWNGISSMAGSVYNKAQEIANTVRDKIKNALKIFSPSRVMVDIGMNVGRGMLIGMDSQIAKIGATSEDMAVAATPPPIDTRELGSNISNSETTNSFSGNIVLSDKSAVDEFFAKLNRNNELAKKGMTLL